MDAQLWDKIRNIRFEEQFAKKDLPAEEAIRLLDFSVYFDIKGEPIPTGLDGIIHYLTEASSASVSRLIKEACNKDYIKKLEDTAPRHTKYMPIWA